MLSNFCLVNSLVYARKLLCIEAIASLFTAALLSCPLIREHPSLKYKKYLPSFTRRRYFNWYWEPTG